MSDRPLAELADIHLVRGDTRVFDGLSLRLDFGTNTAILGPNGAGKTSLLKLLASEIHPLVRPGSGVRLLGLERWNVWELRHHLGLLSQDLQNAYEPDVAGLQIVLSGLYSSIGTYAHQTFSPAEVDRARKLMADLGIGELERTDYGRMSTGQQRRFLLARALIHDPQALILDEPTSGLDLSAGIHYLQLMRRLMQEGRTLVLVTHHLHEIPPEIDRVVLLKQGRIVADGPKAELFTSARLSELYDVPLRLIEADGWYQAVPA
ncbi:MAG TPA: ATP-binding cassette domain-containing protein [Mariprofundaceae bacterium]|nr:ATP-binding cassette domain-containing protein [Mariprofundaceae bacterium]